MSGILSAIRKLAKKIGTRDRKIILIIHDHVVQNPLICGRSLERFGYRKSGML